jgi:type VI secretion system protein
MKLLVKKSATTAAMSLACLLLCWVMGCAKVQKARQQVTRIARIVTLRPGELEMNVGIAAAANQNSPVAVDLAFIKDKNFWKTAPSMTAKDWFAQKSDLQRRYGSKLTVKSWEWTPGQPVGPMAFSVPRGLYGAMVFANYPTAGTHSAPIPLNGGVVISLQKNDFTLERP